MSEAITKACNAYRCDGGICKYTEMPWVTCSKCKGTGRLPDIEATLRAEVARLTDEVERLMSQLKSAEEVVTQARQLVAYSWEDRLDDSRVSDDAKQDARELEIAVWHYDQRIKTKGTAT